MKGIIRCPCCYGVGPARHIRLWQRCFLMLLLVTVTSADMVTHSYNSNLEFGLGVFNCYAKPLDFNMNVEIAIPSVFITKKKQGENVTETYWAAPSFTAPTHLLSYTDVTQCYSDCRLIYLPPSCSLALLQSSNSGRATALAGTSPRQLQPSPLRGSPTATQLQQYRGSFSKHPRRAAGFSLSSDTLFGLTVYLCTSWTVNSLLLHYFCLASSSSQLTTHTPQWSGSHCTIHA